MWTVQRHDNFESSVTESLSVPFSLFSPSSCPQVPLSAWSARTEVPCVRPSSGWSWRMSGSSACGTSFRQLTAARTGPSTSWQAATFDPETSGFQCAAAETQSEMRTNLIPNQPAITIFTIPMKGQRESAGAQDAPKCPTCGHMAAWNGFPDICTTTVHYARLWRGSAHVLTFGSYVGLSPLQLLFYWRIICCERKKNSWDWTLFVLMYFCREERSLINNVTIWRLNVYMDFDSVSRSGHACLSQGFKGRSKDDRLSFSPSSPCYSFCYTFVRHPELPLFSFPVLSFFTCSASQTSPPC